MRARLCFIYNSVACWCFYSGLGIEAVVTARHAMDLSDKNVSGVYLQYPDTQGCVYDLTSFVNQAHANNVRKINACISDSSITYFDERLSIYTANKFNEIIEMYFKFNIYRVIRDDGYNRYS